MNPADAIPRRRVPAGRQRRPANLQQAIFAYNHSAAYVADVLAWATRYAAYDAQAISASAPAGVPACH